MYNAHRYIPSVGRTSKVKAYKKRNNSLPIQQQLLWSYMYKFVCKLLAFSECPLQQCVCPYVLCINNIIRRLISAHTFTNKLSTSYSSLYTYTHTPPTPMYICIHVCLFCIEPVQSHAAPLNFWFESYIYLNQHAWEREKERERESSTTGFSNFMVQRM